MKNFLRFLIFSTFCLLFVASNGNLTRFSDRELRESRFQALHDVIHELFLKPGLFFEIIVAGKLSTHVSDTINGVSKLLDGIQPLTLHQDEMAPVIEHPSLIIVDDKLDQKVDLKSMSFGFNLHDNPKFLISVDGNFNLTHLAVNPASYPGHFSQYSYFLVDNGNQIELKTFEWWTEKACSTLQLVTLNTFDKKSLKWQHNLEILDKFMDFHGCTLKTDATFLTIFLLDIAENLGVIDFHPGIPQTLKKKENQERKLLEIIAARGNFKFVPIKHENAKDILTDIQMDSAKDYNFYMKSYPFGGQFQCTKPFFQLSLGAMYSPPESYTNYEKMVLPFDDLTWMYLGITFGAAFALIFIMNLLPPVFKDVFYGKEVKMPSFNVIGTFFGIGQTKLPRNNFARIILISFIIFCLIFRTAYQGKLLFLFKIHPVS